MQYLASFYQRNKGLSSRTSKEYDIAVLQVQILTSPRVSSGQIQKTSGHPFRELSFLDSDVADLFEASLKGKNLPAIVEVDLSVSAFQERAVVARASFIKEAKLPEISSDKS